jgi:hypothetical protein
MKQCIESIESIGSAFVRLEPPANMGLSMLSMLLMQRRSGAAYAP